MTAADALAEIGAMEIALDKIGTEIRLHRLWTDLKISMLELELRG